MERGDKYCEYPGIGLCHQFTRAASASGGKILFIQPQLNNRITEGFTNNFRISVESQAKISVYIPYYYAPEGAVAIK